MRHNLKKLRNSVDESAGERSIPDSLAAIMTDTHDLCSLMPGDTVEVIRIDGDDLLAKRLEANGFWPGTLVSMVRRAPLGGPIQLRLRGFRLALRRSEAQRVLVRHLAVPAPAPS